MDQPFPQLELKRCGARKGKLCPCRATYNTWQEGRDPLADVPTAPVWIKPAPLPLGSTDE